MNFQDSILNSNGQYDLVLDSTGAIIIVTDHSNYVTSDEEGHLEADFSLYRKLIITDKNDLTYTFSSVDDAVEGSIEVCDPGDSGNNTFSYTYQAGDGVYQARLISIPTWRDDAEYLVANGVYVVREVDDVVIIYKLIDDSINEAPEDTPAKWEVVTDETSVSAKYNVVGYASVIVHIWEVFVRTVLAARRKNLLLDFENQKKPQEVIKAEKLDLAILGITFLSNAHQWDEAGLDIAEATKIADKAVA